MAHAHKHHVSIAAQTAVGAGLSSMGIREVQRRVGWQGEIKVLGIRRESGILSFQSLCRLLPLARAGLASAARRTPFPPPVATSPELLHPPRS